jgi:hypothetical protein
VSHLISAAGTWPISSHCETACLSGSVSPTLIAASVTAAMSDAMFILLW